MDIKEAEEKYTIPAQGNFSLVIQILPANFLQ